MSTETIGCSLLSAPVVAFVLRLLLSGALAFGFLILGFEAAIGVCLDGGIIASASTPGPDTAGASTTDLIANSVSKDAASVEIVSATNVYNRFTAPTFGAASTAASTFMYSKTETSSCGPASASIASTTIT